ncbi:MAG TPA: hypothetical protein VHD33_02065 [Legionellaceae bacterium]|nr:hypothetical protein [Legionellaceae bacterium]
MKVTVKSNPDMKDFVIVTLHYKLGDKVINLHNDDWCDLRDALQEYWESETAKRALV